jgi:hypothetical protein
MAAAGSSCGLVAVLAYGSTDQKTYPAMVCVKSDVAFDAGHTGSGVYDLESTVGFWVENDHQGSWLTVTCPLVRDAISFRDGLDDAEVWVVDNNADGEGGDDAITCEICLQDTGDDDHPDECPGAGCTFECLDESSGGGGSREALEFGPLDEPTALSTEVVLNCEIPPRTSNGTSSIISIRWVDNDTQ